MYLHLHLLTYMFIFGYNTKIASIIGRIIKLTDNRRDFAL